MTRQSAQVTLQPGVLRWARERASLDKDELALKVRVKPKRAAVEARADAAEAEAGMFREQLRRLRQD